MAHNEVVHETMDITLEAAARGMHNQDQWADETDCGTTACLAGWRALADGFVLVRGGSDPDTLQHPDGRVLWMPLEAYSESEDTVCGYVQKRMGLTTLEATTLFHGDNTIEDLKHIADAICAGDTDEIIRIRNTQDY